MRHVIPVQYIVIFSVSAPWKKYEHDDGIDRREFENRQLPVRFLSASAR